MKNSRLISLSMVAAVMLACSSVSSLIATPTPVPTSTLLPTFTPTPSPTSAPILFDESTFSSGGCFNFEITSDVKRYEENGQLHMDVAMPGLIAWILCENNTFADFVMEADATQVGGVNDNGYGLVLRYADASDEYYVFAISGDGFYVFAFDGLNMKTPEILVNWTESAAIKQGNQTNHLKAVAIGGNFQLFVNDQFLAEARDARLSSGTVGFFVLASDAGTSHISFDNLKISKP